VPTEHEPRRRPRLAFACLVCRPLRCGDVGAILACKHGKLVGPKLTFLSVFALACAAGRQRHASSSIITATAMTTTAMYPNNDTLGERLRLYVEEHFHDA
jgi:hypothetical protein